MTATTPSETVPSGGRENTAALREQRDFLLRSLEDLEAERDAGDIDEYDYVALKDDYTARAAAVIRTLDQRSAPNPKGRPAVSKRGRTALVTAAVVLVALIAGFAVKETAGRRDPGDGITGGAPGSSRTLLAQGDALLSQQQDPEGALAAYDEALAIDPENVEILLHRATAQAALNDLDAASVTYDEVLALEPENLEALTYQALIVFQQGSTDAALTQLDQAIALDPAFLDPWGLKLAILAANDRLEEGLVEVEALAAGGDADIALAIAQQASNGRQLQAVDGLRVFDAVIAGAPDDAAALAYRGWQPALIARQDGVSLDDQETLLLESLEFLDRAVAADPDLSDARAFRAIVLHQLDRDEEAADELRAFDGTDPPEGMQAIVDQSDLRDELGVPAPS